jgi:FkbM family methyltransferase
MNNEKSYADYETDLEIQKYFDPGYSGVCIDIGAGFGTERSNTYYFEKKYWRCLCIEPNPGLYNHMRMYRRLALNIACSNYDKKGVAFQIYDINDGNQEAISSLVVDKRLVESHKGMINKVEEIKVEVKKLDTVLSRINLEKIDFVSIDTEGTELEVLMGFDINRWKPSLFIIENNFEESKFLDYLRDFGYKFSQRIGVNDFFTRGEEMKRQEEQKSDSSLEQNLDYIFEV